MFAAEATAKLTRRPGLAVLTAGPGVTNGVSAITTAHFNGVAGGGAGRAGPDRALGHGQPAGARPPAAGRARHQARRHRRRRRRHPRRGRPGAAAGRRARTAARCSSTSPWRRCSPRPTAELPDPGPPPVRQPDPDAVAAVARLLAGRAAAGAGRSGSDVWAGRAEDAARRCAEALAPAGGRQRAGPRHPAPGGTRCWSPGPGRRAFGSADLVVVVGHPARLPARLRQLRRPRRRPRPRSCTWPTRPAQLAGHLELAGSVAGDLGLILDVLAEAVTACGGPATGHGTVARAPARPRPLAAVAGDRELLDSPTPTRSTRPGSTASCCRSSPTTRS